MLRVFIVLDPVGEVAERRPLAQVDIVNMTAYSGRMSSDYAWRVIDRNKGIDAAGWLVDSTIDDSPSLLLRVLQEWKSGRRLPFDHHGREALPEGVNIDAGDYWKRFDEERQVDQPAEWVEEDAL